MWAVDPMHILRKEYGDSRNLMTPHILGRGKIHEDKDKMVVYELAKGSGMPRFGGHIPTIYGISVVSYNKVTMKTERLYDDSICSEFKLDIDNKIKELKNRYKGK